MFISCGDTLVDLFSQPQASVGDVALAGHVGGSPLNVALGLARLGNHAGLLCKNSGDFVGQRILQYLEANQVDTQWIVPTELNSTLAMVQKKPDGSADYAFYIDNTADRSLLISDLPAQLPEQLKALHFGSYSTVLSPSSDSYLQLAQRESARRLISYDPNIRPSIEPDMAIWRASFEQFANVADLVKASDEDIASLFHEDPDPEKFAADLISRGVQLVIVTEGSAGSRLYTADGRQLKMPVPSVEVVDTVGAGDTYQAATLHFLNAEGCIRAGELDLSSLDADALAAFAGKAAAITCTRRGADLPRLVELSD